MVELVVELLQQAGVYVQLVIDLKRQVPLSVNGLRESVEVDVLVVHHLVLHL